jgi:PAS domain S-box-containing protein
VQSIEAARWVNRTHEVLEQVGTILSLVLDGEAARRGYVLTGNPSFLDQYETIPEKLQASLQRLQKLAADDAFQQERLKELKPLIQKKLENLQTSIELRKQQGTALTDQELLTEQGKKMTDQIRRLTGEMQQEERTLLIERAARSQVSARTVVSLIALGSLLSLLTVSVSLLMVNLDMSKRKRAENALRDSEEKYRVLYESSREAIMMLAPPEWEFTAGNPAAIALFGAKDEREFVAEAPWRLSPEYQPDGELSSVKARQMIDAAMERGSHFFEWTHKKFSGEEFFATVTLTRMIYRGQPLLQATFRDITERKRAEAEMAERHRLETLVAEVGVALTGAESLRQGLQQCAEIMVRDINAAFARIWTVNEEDKVLELQVSAGMYTHLDGGHARVPMGQFKIGRIAENGEPHLTNTVQQDPWVGDPEWARREGMVAFAGYPLRVGEDVLGVVAAFARQPLAPATLQAFASVAHNLAQFIKRKRAEEALRESEEKYRALIETTGTGYVIVDMQGRVIDANPEYVRLTGRRALQEILGRRVTEWTAQHDLARTAEAVRRCAELGFTRNLEIEHVNGEGKCTPIEVNATAVLAAGGVRIVGLCRDITERRQAAAALRESEAKYHALFQASADGILIADLETRMFSYANPAACHLLGYSEAELTTMGLADIHPKDDLPWVVAEFEAQVRGDKTLAAGVPCLRKDGAIVYADVNAVGMSVDGRVCNAGFFRDITERKRAEQALAQERGLLRALMDNLPDYIYFKDRQSRFLRTNRAHAKAFGLSDPAQAVGKTDFDFFAAEHAQQAYNDEQEVINNGNQMTAKEEKETWPDGRVTWVSTIKMPFRDANGAIVGTFGLSRDITERKRAEQALREAEEQFRLLFAATPLPTFLWDLETLQYLEVNDAAVSHSGYSRDELLRMRVTDLLPPEAAPRILSQMQVIRTQSRDRGQGRHRLKDGRVVDVEADAHALHFRGRRAVLGVIQDITERKRAQQALRESEERYRDLAENAAELIQGVSPQGQFLYVNRAWRQTLGYSEGEIARLSITDILSPQHLTRYQQVLAMVMAGETVNDFETVFVAKNGTQIIVEGSVNCRLVDGKAVATSGIFRNVAARREIEKMKNEFVSTVSHELRTPLTSIRGSLGLLAGGLLTADPGKARRMVDIAVANTDRLVRLINDILDIERIESGRVKMEKRACEAASLMLQAVDSVRELADKAGVKLEVSPGPGRILADPDRVIQTMTNLLDNAIKFSPQGSTISLHLRRQNGDMLFEVKDRGRGIPADRLSVIFERFQQVDASDRREKGGTGLGLAICRSIVEQHGGRIWVESVLGQGSSFYFTLPVMEEPVVPVIPAEAPGARTVLVCDDDASILAVVQELLEQRGYRVVAVGSGREAVEQAVAQLPDAILLDLLMPEMNGWETMTALRERPETCEIPIIILSVLPPRDLRKTDVEVAGWIQKPVDETLLFQTLSIAISRPGKSARVLVVEDDVDLARVIREVFERHGHKVYLAQTGREAVQLAEHVLPNLVVLDLVLPEGDGFEVVSALRQNKVLRGVPLVVHTAKDLDDAERAKLRLGKTVFLTKGRGSHEEFEKRVLGLLKGIMSATVERGSP